MGGNAHHKTGIKTGIARFFVPRRPAGFRLCPDLLRLLRLGCRILALIRPSVRRPPTGSRSAWSHRLELALAELVFGAPLPNGLGRLGLVGDRGALWRPRCSSRAMT